MAARQRLQRAALTTGPIGLDSQAQATRIRRAVRANGAVLQRWSDTESDDGGWAEIEELLAKIDWDQLVPEGERDALADKFGVALAAAGIGASDAEDALDDIRAGKAPVDTLQDLLSGFAADISSAKAETLGKSLQTAVSDAASEHAAKVLAQKTADDEATAKASAAALQQQQAAQIADLKQARDEATLEIAALQQRFAADPILKSLRLKPQEDRNLAIGPASELQAAAAARLWRLTPDGKHLTNFHIPGGAGGFVSKWRPPLVDVNVALKCYVFGNKEIIVHISAPPAMHKRMVDYHHADWKRTQTVRQYIPAAESE